MAVVQISRIQHRSGTSDNLPQLARGEIGLAVDTRRLYIGNGGSNAPQTENLEILTSRSNLLEVSETYTYKDALLISGVFLSCLHCIFGIVQIFLGLFW